MNLVLQDNTKTFNIKDLKTGEILHKNHTKEGRESVLYFVSKLNPTISIIDQEGNKLSNNFNHVVEIPEVKTEVIGEAFRIYTLLVHSEDINVTVEEKVLQVLEDIFENDFLVTTDISHFIQGLFKEKVLKFDRINSTGLFRTVNIEYQSGNSDLNQLAKLHVK